MSELIRTFAPDLEVRSAAKGGDGRTIYGIAVPYNAPQMIDENLTEQFAQGAFNHMLRSASRVWFARDHVRQGGSVIGATKMLRDDASGLYGEWRVSKTPLGDETLELVKDGALNQLSIMFRERQNRRVPGTRITERVTADVSEVAVVLEGAYGDLAAAGGVRSAIDQAAEEGCVHCRTERLREAEQLLAGLPLLPV